MYRRLLACHRRLIVFYTFNYELDILRGLESVVEVAEWNGHKKEQIPDQSLGFTFVQYTAGAEGELYVHGRHGSVLFDIFIQEL